MISVIIPVYNVEKYLRECLDSVTGQTYTDLQIIVVDDGSTDGSGAVCDEYARKDARVQVIHQQNQGLSAARNAGIDQAAGEYILFVDSDDYLLPRCAETLYRLVKAHQADIGVCSYQLLMADGSTRPATLVPPDGVEVYNGREIQQAYLRQQKIGDIAWGKLYARGLFETIRYPVGRYYEDMMTTFKLLHKAGRVVSTPEVGCMYRQRADSIVGEPFSIRRLDLLEGKIAKLEYAAAHCTEFVPDQYDSLLSGCIMLTKEIVAQHVHIRAADQRLQQLYRQHFLHFVRHARSVKSRVYAVLGGAHLTLVKTALRITTALKK